MAAVGIFMYQRWDSVPVGIFGNEDLAKQVADAGDGEYVLIPIEANQAYTNLIDESLPGAIVYRSQGLQSRVSDLESTVTAAATAFNNLKTDFETFKTQAQNAVSNINDLITDLESRVTTLEGG